MSRADPLQSASGLRPASAFVLIGLVLLLVGARAARIALFDEGEQPCNLTQLPVPPVTFDILDASGVPMALSVECLELVMSPNAMWQAHTPDKLAGLLSAALGPTCPRERLLERMLPDAKSGLIHVDSAPFLMNAGQARAVHAWIARGGRDPDADPLRIDGMWVEPTNRPGEYDLVWDPVRVLSETSRTLHKARNTVDWSRRIATDLIACLQGDDALEKLDSEEALNAERKRIWDALMPSQYKSVLKDVAPSVALEIFDILKEERVRKHQMELVRNAKRMYPVRSDQWEDPPVAVLGRWGTLEPEQARARARAELLLPDDAYCSDQDLDRLRILTVAKIYQPSPMCGLELLCDRLLASDVWQSTLERRPEEYTFLANQVPRQPLQRYFQELIPASPTPTVITTLDIGLQRMMRAQLEKLVEVHKPALAMAIALEVESGKVLAVDAIDPYDTGGFLPLVHTFTPGSTMKVVIMASALEAGVIRPETPFNTFNGAIKIGPRTIREAEGARSGWISAAEGLAFSINAVLVQIGLRVPAETLHQNFLSLGYAQYPRAGLGGERPGRIPSLPWKDAYEHASVSFGHELSATLWQHAAGLATVVRGGEYRPLSLIEAVEQNGVRQAVPVPTARRVFAPATCEEVREMMHLGAREGTGRNVYCPDIVMGTKTGTAQKVSDELCLHVELAHNRAHGCHGARACRKELAGQKDHRGFCYTSSMCAFGHLPDSPREVMVLVVVDEPRGGKKYGAEVAGPAAVAILREALGLTRGGSSVEAAPSDGFSLIAAVASNPVRSSTGSSTRSSTRNSMAGSADQPWAEVTDASR